MWSESTSSTIAPLTDALRLPVAKHMLAESCHRLLGAPATGSAFAPHPARGPAAVSPKRSQGLPASPMKATLDKLKQELHGNGHPSALPASVRKPYARRTFECALALGVGFCCLSQRDLKPCIA